MEIFIICVFGLECKIKASTKGKGDDFDDDDDDDVGNIYMNYIRVIPLFFLFDSQIKHFDNATISRCAFEHRRNVSPFYVLCRDGVFHHFSVSVFYSILFDSFLGRFALFSAVQFSSLFRSTFVHFIFFIVSLIGCLYLCGRREIQIR